MKKVAVVLGSDSDLGVMSKCVDILKQFEVPYDVRIMSAHRTPDIAAEYSAAAAENGFGVIICAAGMAAHLAGAFAANTVLPIIGVPIKSSAFDGLDALMSTVMMPPGIPVATVGVDAAKNAGLLAIQILALSEPALTKKLADYRRQMREAVIEKDNKIREEM